MNERDSLGVLRDHNEPGGVSDTSSAATSLSCGCLVDGPTAVVTAHAKGCRQHRVGFGCSDAAAVTRRTLVAAPDGENRQEQMLRRVGECDGPYVGENPSEATTLANLYKRGWLDRERVGGRWCYRLRVDPLDSDQQELIV